ncbi:hypothetical protein BCR43DRAFT_520075 [Syncephalastrum racemosum]|uniref:FAD dependent oxidoreductase domain-containing protein n=1 Tax=Syncephalastrum racemosum TaxID=13706 RepID=A0A1X2HTE5_SYNRA|nr:hypothetical protein BCR43DRAFT_520075 [Syncephalastrum racemosum]
MPKIIVFGAGVIGLTTAVVLLKNGYEDVTVVGKYHPGDELTHEFTSPWAGASIVSFAAQNTLLQEIDQISFKEFARQANLVPEAGVMYCPGLHLSEIDDPAHEAWAKKLYLNTEKVAKEQLPEGVRFGYRFLSFSLTAPRYLDWLVGQVKQLGGRLERGTFESIQDVAEKYQAETVINCTGLGSRVLADVRDETLHPVRGQTVLIRAPHIKTQMYREGPDVYTYIIPRPDGTAIVGGTLDYVTKEAEPDPAVTQSILARVYALNPELTHSQGPAAFDIVTENVGFRPTRQQSVRLEKESQKRGKCFILPKGGRYTIVHNYGHGPHGYQSCWGSAAKVLELLGGAQKAKL